MKKGTTNPKGAASGGGAGGGGGRRASAVRRSRESQSRKLVGLLVGIAVVGVAALGYAYTTQKPKVRTVDPNAKPLVAEGHVLGNPAAPLQVIEFGDFECPQCGNFSVITEPDIRKRLITPGTISLRYFDYPLPMHKNTWPASNAAACAGEQGKFWEMHDQLFANQGEWNGEATSRPKGMFLNYAKGLGLDVGKFEQCFDDEKYRPQIEASAQEAERRGVNGTPTFIIGKRMVNNVGYDEFKRLVDSAIVEAKAAAPATRAAVAPAPTSAPATTSAPR